ncbi:hypothetical protein G039_0313495 [Pseudomonas aeruginosa VRFPA01]|nr:hypothetical protein G039_0313495 [Pseudomonas aeruginosa VRFPA01]
MPPARRCKVETPTPIAPIPRGQVLDRQGKARTGRPHARSLATLIRLSSQKSKIRQDGQEWQIVSGSDANASYFGLGMPTPQGDA